MQQLFAFIFRELAHGNACPCVYNIRDVVFGNDGFFIVPLALPIGLNPCDLRRKTLLLVAQRGGAFIVLVVDGFFLFLAQRFDALAQLFYVRRCVVSAKAYAACGFIH